MTNLLNKDYEKIYSIVDKKCWMDSDKFKFQIDKFYNKYRKVKSFQYSGCNLSKSYEEDDYSRLYIHYIINCSDDESYQATFSINLGGQERNHPGPKLIDFRVLGRQVAKEKAYFLKLDCS